MSARKRKSSVINRSVGQTDDPTVEKTLAPTSNQDVESDAEPTIPPKQVKLEESTKVEASNVPETQTGVSGKPDLDDSLSEEQKKSKPVGKLKSTLHSSSTSADSNKNRDSSELGSDKDSSYSGTIKKDSLESQNKKSSFYSSIYSDESNPSSVASGENALDEDSDEKESTTSEVEDEETLRESSIPDTDDLSTTSSSSDNKSDDTTSSSSLSSV